MLQYNDNCSSIASVTKLCLEQQEEGKEHAQSSSRKTSCHLCQGEEGEGAEGRHEGAA